MDWLRVAAAEGATEGLAVFAEEQTAGRGQAGRTWVAPYGRCLLGSVLLQPPLAPPDGRWLTWAGACAAAAAITSVAGCPVRLKWPNDVTYEGAKVAGVLVDQTTMGDVIEYAIVGIGINVNLEANQLANIPGATSLLLSSGHWIRRNALAHKLLEELDARYTLILRGQSNRLFDEWQSRLETVGQQVWLKSAGESAGPFLVDSVRDDGALVLLAADGTRTQIQAGLTSIQPVTPPSPDRPDQAAPVD